MVPLRSVSAAAIAEVDGVAALQANRFVEIRERLLVLAELGVRVAPAAERQGTQRREVDRLVKILQGQRILILQVEAVTAIDVDTSA